MRVGLKNTGQLPYAMIVQVWSLIRFGREIPQFRFILKIFLLARQEELTKFINRDFYKKFTSRFDGSCYTKHLLLICRFVK
jgi:hypothetical protein